MDNKPQVRGYLTRAVQFFLGLDGVLHGLEVISAYHEKAWLTFMLTSFHAAIFFLAIYFVGHDHSHHHNHDSDPKTPQLNWMKWVLPFVVIALLIMSGAVEELLHAGHDH
jgi:heme A synthase